VAVAAAALPRRPAPAGEGGGILEYARALVDFAEGRVGAPAAPPSRFSLGELREAIRRLGRDPEEVLRRVWRRLAETAPVDLRAEPDSPAARRLKLERMKPYLDIAQNQQLLEVAARHAERLARGALSPRMSRTTILKPGNRKLSSRILIFNLPDAFTCPTPSPGCLAFCYAKPVKSANPKSTSLARYARYLLTRGVALGEGGEERFHRFADVVSAELRKWLRSRSRRPAAVRIHESGDFYSPEYFEEWLEVARRFPDLTFYAYTKAWDIVLPRLAELPDNFVVIFSLDKTNFGKLREALPRVLEARRLGKRVGFSYVDTHTEEDRRNLEELERIFGEVYECPATNPEKKRQLLERAAAEGGREVKVCGDICNYCSTDPKVVKFNVH
jgi:hypothetical protein